MSSSLAVLAVLVVILAAAVGIISYQYASMPIAGNALTLSLTTTVYSTVSNTVTTTQISTMTVTENVTFGSSSSSSSKISSTSSLANNLLLDGGFETGTIAPDTSVNSSFWTDWCFNLCEFAINSSFAHSGNRSLEEYVGGGDALFSTTSLWPHVNYTLQAGDRFQASVYFGGMNSTAGFAIYFVNKTGPSVGLPKVIYELSPSNGSSISCCLHNQTMETDIFMFNVPLNTWVTITRYPLADMASSGMNTTSLSYYSFQTDGVAYVKPTFFDDISIVPSS